MTEGIKRERPAQAARKRRRRIVLISGISVVALILGTIGVYALVLSQTFNSTEKIPEVFPEETHRPPVLEGEAAKSQNILLLGSDSRDSAHTKLADIVGRTDTIMVVHIPADRENVQVMSIMRDSWVDIPGKGESKVNAAMVRGGVPLVVATVENLIGARIDHVAIVDFEGFKGITDALGGVTVNNDKAFTSAHKNRYFFPAGNLELNGELALAFVRERASFPDGDYQRVRNQQKFIKAVMDKTLSRETLTNPVTISNLVGAVAPFMAVDEGLNSAYAAGLGFEMANIRGDDVTFFTMPTLGTGMVGSQSIVRVDFDELAVIQGHFRADTLDQYEAKRQSLGGSVEE